MASITLTPWKALGAGGALLTRRPSKARNLQPATSAGRSRGSITIRLMITPKLLSVARAAGKGDGHLAVTRVRVLNLASARGRARAVKVR